MKKIFRKKYLKYYIIYYLLLEITLGFGFTRGLITFTYNFVKLLAKVNDIETLAKILIILLGMLILFVCACIILTLPVTIFLLARKTVDYTQEVQNKKYKTRKDIIYYREKLKGISPTTISLMKNLKIEEKDIAASIVKLQLNKNIVIEDNEIKKISEDVSNLSPSEQRLFYMITGEQINKTQIEGWKSLAIEEAKKQGYIQEKSTSTGLFSKKAILIFLFVLCIIGFDKLSKKFETQLTEITNSGITSETTIFEMVDDENFDNVVNVTYLGLISMICLIGIIGWPLFYIIYIFRYQNKNNSMKRTIKGEELTDEILGMKRFIHDFSMLNEAEREQLVLWDEFLIYAIILEENEKIPEEILELKNVKNFDTRIFLKKN